MAQKPVRLDDDVYTLVTEYANKTGRSIANATNYIVRMGIQLENRMEGSTLELKGNTIVATIPKNTEPPKPTGISGEQYNSYEKNSGAAPSPLDDLFSSEPVGEPLPKYGGEQPCCLNEFQPCKHWVWDTQTGEGYINSLSGRFMEVE